MSLSLMKALLPVGLLSVWGVLIFVTIAGTLVVAFVLIRKRRRKSLHGV